MTYENRARVREGMRVVDSLGRDAGTVGHVLVGATSRGPRFLTVHHGMLRRDDRLVPCEAIEGVDAEGRLRLRLPRETLDMLPEYDGGVPSREQARHAYTLLGGQPGDPASGEGAHMVPFEDTARAPEPALHARAPARVVIEEILVIAPEERARQGYADEWVVGGGPGP